MFRLPYAVALLSGASLAYEILLIRLFSIVDWHHLAFLVISLALLGYGASGTLLALAREKLLRHFAFATSGAAALFGATAVGAFLLSQRIDFNSLEIFWSTRQLGTLFVLYLLFAIPFFCAATAIGLTLTRFGEESPQLYRADLIGGGVASAGIVALLFIIHPATALQLIGALGFLAAILFHSRAFLVAVAGIALIAFARPLPLRISQFKELSHALRVPGARVIEEHSSPLGLLTVVESPSVPFRHAPGLSLGFTGELPEQTAVFSDGGGLSAIAGPNADLSYLDFVPPAAAYHLGRRVRRVAVIGAGGGADVLSALRNGAERVTAVELNPQMVDIVSRRSGVHADPRVRVVQSEARRFVRESNERFDLIQITLVDSFGASAAGVSALSESHLYTVESLTELIDHLQPGGLLVITRWMQVPPREIVKLFATAVAAKVSGRQLAIVRSWNTASLVIKRGDFDAAELAALRRFCEERSFDLDYAPGVAREETNRFNVLDEPYLFDAATSILGRTDFFERYKFHVRPATDERPYFFHFFRWRVLPELLRLRARGGMPLLEWGYLVLVAGLAQAILASVVLILLPLSIRRIGGLRVRRSTLILYFGSIGLAFLFIEIAFMQRLTLFLGHPLYAVAVVLASFLLFAGIGSGFSVRIRNAKFVPLIVAIAALAALVAVRLLTAAALGLTTPVKIVIAILVIAPLAFVMGMPFPLGLRRLAATDPAAIPWAWGVNGTASVLSSMCATLVAVHIGFSALVALAAALYLVAAFSGSSR